MHITVPECLRNSEAVRPDSVCHERTVLSCEPVKSTPYQVALD